MFFNGILVNMLLEVLNVETFKNKILNFLNQKFSKLQVFKYKTKLSYKIFVIPIAT